MTTRFLVSRRARCWRLLIFLRIDALLVLVGVVAAAVLSWLVDRRPPRLGFMLTLAAGGGARLAVPHRAAARVLLAPADVSPQPAGRTDAGGARRRAPRWPARSCCCGIGWRRVSDRRCRPSSPRPSWCWRSTPCSFAQPGGRLADADAFAFRTFVDVYLFWPGLVLALVGLGIVAHRDFWRDPAFFFVVAAFSLFLFYKIKIVPGALLDEPAVSAGHPAGCAPVRGRCGIGRAGPGWLRGWRLARTAVGTVVLGVLGWQYAVAAAPLVHAIASTSTSRARSRS